MSLAKQIILAAAVLLALGIGAFLYHRSQADGEAEAAVGRGQSAAPVEITKAETGIVRERIEAVGTTLARQAVDIVPLTSGRVAEIAWSPGQPVEAGAVLVRLDDEDGAGGGQRGACGVARGRARA